MSILTHLRDFTRTDHESVERHVTSCLEDAAAYRRLLERFLGLFRPLEEALLGLSGLPEVIPDLAKRSRSRLLESDLAALGVAEEAISAMPNCPYLPPLETIAQALGCLYVLEGSTLGGQVVAREVGNLGLAADARGFFLSHGRNVGLMWRKFGAAIDTYAAANPEQAATICENARLTFRRLEAWIAESAQSGVGRSDG